MCSRETYTGDTRNILLTAIHQQLLDQHEKLNLFTDDTVPNQLSPPPHLGCREVDQLRCRQGRFLRFRIKAGREIITNSYNQLREVRRKEDELPKISTLLRHWNCRRHSIKGEELT